MSRPVRLTLAFLGGTASVGLAATLFVFLQAGPSIGHPGRTLLLAGLVVAASTFGNLFARFMRWQFLLRRLAVRLPTIDSLGAFAGSFAFLPVPLYLGQIVARVRLLPTLTPTERAHVVFAAVWERTLDVWALALLAALAGPFSVALSIVALAGLVLLRAVRGVLLRRVLVAVRSGSRLLVGDVVAFDETIVARVAAGPVWAPCALASLAAWGLTAIAAVFVCRAVGADVESLAAAGVAARATLLGAASLVPLGAGVAGLLLVRSLQSLGATAAAAAAVTFVFRVGTAWLTIGVGVLALLLHLRRRGRAATHDHFDAIDECYDAWLPERYRMHLVARKTAPVIVRVAPGTRGLDIGCGRGWYLRALRDAGAPMVGVDTSTLQLAAARQYLGDEAPLVRASVLGLPFAAATFDFAYIINVLHHLPSPAHQRHALEEIAWVVRPGGLVFVHEMSVRNLFFRFYLSYVFPILKGIEEGTEHYLDPQRMNDVAGLAMRSVEYFTFIPDFVPPAVLPMLARLERRLEAGPLARYAAHFLAVYERTADAAAPRAEPSTRR